MRRDSTTQNKVRGLVASDAKRPDFNRKSADRRSPAQRRYGARLKELHAMPGLVPGVPSRLSSHLSEDGGTPIKTRHKTVYLELVN